jgi:hypothetical protein
LNNYANELNDMEASAKLIPFWMLTAISRIMEAEMNAREATTRGATTSLSDSLTAKSDESIVDGVVPSETTKPHLTIVKNENSGCH